MHKLKKEQVLKELRKELTGISMCVIVHYSGMNAAEMVQLRQVARKEGFSLKIAKNTLLKLAVKDTSCESLQESFAGPVMIAYSYEKDYLPMVKTLHNFAKKKAELKIIQGSIAGDLVDEQGINYLAALPSFDELRTGLVFALQSPATYFIRLVERPAQELVRTLQAKIEQAETK